MRMNQKVINQQVSSENINVTEIEETGKDG